MLASKRLLIFIVLFLTFLASGRAIAQGAPPPVVGALSVSNVTQTSARFTASVTTYGQQTQVFFEYAKPTDARYTQAGNTTIAGSGIPSTASFNLSGLACGTNYVFRAIAVNQFGQDGPHTPKAFTTDSCLTVSLASSGSAVAGGTLTLTATASGNGALTYDFDIDGDEVYDRSGPSNTISVTYPGAFDKDVAVRVTDSTGSSAIGTRHITINAPHLSVTSVGTPSAVCGDGDASFDPGERWTIPVRVTNDGAVAENGGYALFFPTDQVGGGVTTPETHIMMDTPAVSVGNLAPGASIDTTVSFKFANDAACGATYRLSFAGGADAVASSAGAGTPIASFTLPASCQVTTSCPVAKAIAAPRQGLYYNASRSGNGLSNFLIPGQNGAPPIYFGAWFTANEDRSPTWYIVQGNLLGAAVKAPILKFTRDLGSSTFRATSAEVGRATIAMIDSSHMIMAWTIGTKAGAEVMEHLTGGTPPTPNRTGAWYNPNEPGWGEVLHEYGASGATSTFAVDYIYDANAQPRWVITQDTTSNFATNTSAKGYNVHCPGCPWVADWASFPQASGTASFQFSDGSNAHATTNITLAPPLNGTWVRSNTPLQLLTPPQ